MHPSASSSSAAVPRGFRRVAPAFVLFFMAPFVAEYLLGNISISALGAMVMLAPLYGGGALVVRESARRLGRGWPTMILLALAYGLVEEGLSIQTLFNPNYLGLHLLREAYIPALGIGGWWTPFVLTLHTVWSISVPIAVTEALFAGRRETPWLGKAGLTVSGILFLLGATAVHFGTRKQDPFAASWVQVAAVVGLIVVLAAGAFRLRRHRAVRPGRVPSPWLVGVVTWVLGLAFMSLHAVVHGWTLVSVYGLIFALAIALLTAWSGRAAWTPLHTLSAAGGAMLAYACTAFPQQPVIGAKGTVDLVGNTVFALVAVALLVRAVRTELKARTRPA